MGLTLKNIAVIGSSGAIGKAFTNILSDQYQNAHIYSFSRTAGHHIDYMNEDSLAEAANLASSNGPLDLVIVATGMLHDNEMMPEKSIKELSAEKLHSIFEANAIVPALIAKYFLPKLNRENISIFGALSARVGSISDNQLGGWYAYRASKAALNMILKNAAIEIGRINKKAIILGLHPGTVDSALSRPFHRGVSKNKLFTPEESVQKLLAVLEMLTPAQSGKCLAWDGEEILP